MYIHAVRLRGICRGRSPDDKFTIVPIFFSPALSSTLVPGISLRVLPDSPQTAIGSCGRPRVGSVPTHRESSANSITVALPEFLAISFWSLIAWKIRRTENPVLAAASSGVSEMRGSAREPPACSDWISM